MPLVERHFARCAVPNCDEVIYRGVLDGEAIDRALDAHLERAHPELLEPGVVSGATVYKEAEAS